MPDSPTEKSGADELRERAPHSATIRYIPGLDGLRGIAVIAVMLHHSGVPGFVGGFVGVDVFFVLSGFLITRILLRRTEREGRVSFRHFYERRARRILPALWTMLAVLTVVAIADPTFSPPQQYFHSMGVAAAFMTHVQMALGDFPGPFVHLWSLGWEENFYLVWPLLFALFWRRSRRTLALLLLTGVVTLNSLRFTAHWAGYGGPYPIWIAAYFRVDAILLGCLLGLVVAYEPDLRTGPWLRREVWLGFAALGLLFALFLVPDDQLLWAGGLTLVSLSTALMVNHLRRRAPSRLAHVLENPFLRWTGLISYGLYLWHYPVFHWMREHGFEPATILLVGGPAAFGVAALSYYTVEAWFRKGAAS
jgi:peptidoglycan/LPS O-acetylase OafA/YrhL